MSQQQKGMQSLYEKFLNAFQNHDLKQISECLSDNCVLNDPVKSAKNKKDVLQEHQELLGAFQDCKLTEISTDFTAKGWVTQAVFVGTNNGQICLGGKKIPPTNLSSRVPSAVFYEVDESGLIKTITRYYDSSVYVTQLKLSPELLFGSASTSSIGGSGEQVEKAKA
jgi:hypothetical protein